MRVGPLAAFTGGMLALGGCSTEPGPLALIVIVVDTLRADSLAPWGGSVATPHIDALADAGVVFQRASAHIPITGPSHTSLFTSLLPQDHGVQNNAQIPSQEVLMLAERLQARGWQTSGFVSLGVLGRKFGFRRGFDHYDDRSVGRYWRSADEVNAAVLPWLEQSVGRPLFLWVHYSDPHSPYTPPGEAYPEVELQREGKVLGTLSADARAVDIPARLESGTSQLELVARDGGRPIGCRKLRVSDPAVQLDYTSRVRDLDHFWPSVVAPLPATVRVENPGGAARVSLTLSCSEELSIEEVRARYALEIGYVDRQIGRLVEALKRRWLWDDAVIVFTSDHGEGLGDHGLDKHIEQLYDSLLHVPLIIAAPGRLPPGTVVTAPVQHVDVLPTVLELLGIEPPAARRGRSLLPLVRGETGDAPPILAATYPPEARAEHHSVLHGGYKLISDLTAGGEELYSLEDDPGELHDLAAEQPERVAQLRALLDTELARDLGGAASSPAPLSEEESEQLRALGYAH